MKNKYENAKLTFMVDPDYNIVYPVINGTQVDFCVLLKKNNLSSDNFLESYSVERNLFVRSASFGKVKDYFSGEKYIKGEISALYSENKEVLHNYESNTNEYIVVDYFSYYADKIKFDVGKANSDISNSKMKLEYVAECANVMKESFDKQKCILLNEKRTSR